MGCTIFCLTDEENLNNNEHSERRAFQAEARSTQKSAGFACEDVQLVRSDRYLETLLKNGRITNGTRC